MKINLMHESISCISYRIRMSRGQRIAFFSLAVDLLENNEKELNAKT